MKFWEMMENKLGLTVTVTQAGDPGHPPVLGNYQPRAYAVAVEAPVVGGDGFTEAVGVEHWHDDLPTDEDKDTAVLMALESLAREMGK